MWESLLQNIGEKGIRLSEADEAVIRSVFTYKKFRKHHYLLQQGDVARHETFIVKGLTRTYEVDNDGQEHVLFFGPEQWWVGDLYSFLSGQPSGCNVECLEPTEVLQVSRANLELLYEKVPQMNLYFRLLLQNAFIAVTQRLSSTLSKPAAERYREFLERYPHIGARIPNHQIASFLGITPQSLSRLRRAAVQKQ
jgi:CRP-like cAMP-binding protein